MEESIFDRTKLPVNQCDQIVAQKISHVQVVVVQMLKIVLNFGLFVRKNHCQ